MSEKSPEQLAEDELQRKIAALKAKHEIELKERAKHEKEVAAYPHFVFEADAGPRADGSYHIVINTFGHRRRGQIVRVLEKGEAYQVDLGEELLETVHEPFLAWRSPR
jgi:hypothetical protein